MSILSKTLHCFLFIEIPVSSYFEETVISEKAIFSKSLVYYIF